MFILFLFIRIYSKRERMNTAYTTNHNTFFKNLNVTQRLNSEQIIVANTLRIKLIFQFLNVMVINRNQGKVLVEGIKLKVRETEIDIFVGTPEKETFPIEDVGAWSEKLQNHIRINSK